MLPERPAGPHFAVVVRDHPALPAPNRTAVLSDAFEPARIASGIVRPGETIHPIVAESAVRADPPAWSRFAGALTVVAESPEPRPYLEITRTLPASGFEYLVPPAAAGDGSIAAVAASFGTPVRLAGAGGWTREALDAVADFFLHSPTLAVPVEPFYSLAASLGGDGDATLARAFEELPGRNAYVATGRVSLSERRASRDEWFGRADEDRALLERSDLWQATASLRHRMLATQSECAFCGQFRFCGGWWTTVDDAGASCRLWRDVAGRFEAAMRGAPGGA
jgi:hypothetical protein